MEESEKSAVCAENGGTGADNCSQERQQGAPECGEEINGKEDERASVECAKEEDAKGSVAEEEEAAPTGDADASQGKMPEAGTDEWYRADGEAFDKAYPDLDKEALFADEDFLSYAEGKVGQTPLADIYRGYMRLNKSLIGKERRDAARANATGSLKGASAVGEGEYYSLAEMQSMSAKFIEEHWDKVQKSLKRLK